VGVCTLRHLLQPSKAATKTASWHSLNEDFCFLHVNLGAVLWRSLNEDFCFLVDEGEDFAMGVHLSA